MSRLIPIIAALFFGGTANAYYSVMDTGEIMAPGRYKLTPELQFITDYGNANAGANFDIGLNDESGLRAQVGAGDTDFYLGGFYKYMPYPDVDNQPAIGFNAGVVYARDEDASDFTVRFEPIVSKKFEGDWGSVTPYGSIPIGFQHRSAAQYVDDHNNITIQVAAGAQVDVKQIPDWGFLAEVGIDLNKTFNYLSFGAAWYFGNEAAKKE